MNDQISNATSRKSQVSRVQSAVLSRRSGRSDYKRQSLNPSELRFGQEDRESVITTNNLKKFNIEGGTLAGTTAEEIEAMEQINAAQTLDAEYEEEKEELRDEVASQLTKTTSQAPSKFSKMTYINSLEE